MSSIPPPVPTIALGIRQQPDPGYQPSPPHLEEPLLAPRPHKLTPDLPAEMARTLDSQVSRGLPIPPPPPTDHYRGPSPSFPSRGINLAPGFVMPALSSSPAPLPPPAGSSWEPWNIPQSNSPPSIQTNLPPAPYSQVGQQTTSRQTEQLPPQSLPYPGPPSPSEPLSSAIASMSLSDPSQKKGPESNGPPSLTASFPTVSSLIASRPSPDSSPASMVAWSRDVLRLVDRLYVTPTQSQSGSADPPSGPIHVADQELNILVDAAIPMVLNIANPNPVPQQLPPHVNEAIYLRATFEATGAHPKHVQQNSRMAFRDFERAARGGFSTAWFKLGRDYENFGDFSHAKDCYERGIRNNDESCLYRLGMAHLMGQLGLPTSPEAALPLLQRAATLATLDCPQPAYVFGLLLLGEFSQVSIPTQLISPIIPLGSTRDSEARRHLERAAYFNFAPAQFKLGHAYEFAQHPFPFDALLSVQYYSLASQQGEIEADMALSKWFLCGSEGAFDKDESLAFTFAEKSARKGLPSAEFAMGYYMEVGVGGPKDIEAASKWYTRASEHGNADATERLAALSQPAPQALSRQEHDSLTEVKLVRKRTQAKQRSDARGPPPGQRQGPPSGQNSQQVVANIRKNSLAYRPGPNRAYPSPPNPGPMRPDIPPDGYSQPQPQPQPQRPQPQPQQGLPSGNPGSGFRHQSGPGPGPRLHANSNPGPGLGPGPGGPGGSGPGFPSPRIGGQQPLGQLSRPPSQPQLGQPGYRRPPRVGSGSSSLPPGGPASQPPSRRTPSPPGPSNLSARPPPAKGPATFQEMGFQSQALNEEKCVIM